MSERQGHDLDWCEFDAAGPECMGEHRWIAQKALTDDRWEYICSRCKAVRHEPMTSLA